MIGQLAFSVSCLSSFVSFVEVLNTLSGVYVEFLTSAQYKVFVSIVF